MKRKEFVIRPKHLIIGLLVFIAVAILGFAIVPQLISTITTPSLPRLRPARVRRLSCPLILNKARKPG